MEKLEKVKAAKASEDDQDELNVDYNKKWRETASEFDRIYINIIREPHIHQWYITSNNNLNILNLL